MVFFESSKKDGTVKSHQKNGIMYPTIHQSLATIFSDLFLVIYKVLIETLMMFVEALKLRLQLRGTQSDSSIGILLGIRHKQEVA